MYLRLLLSLAGMCSPYCGTDQDALKERNANKRIKKRLPEVFPAATWRRMGNHLDLSPRQRQIARLICRGCSGSEMAHSLRLSPDTVRMHTRALFKKLNVHERVGVLVRVMLAERRLRRGG